MKYRILLILIMFFVTPCVYSQHVEDAMPVDIPLNSTKESAVQKLTSRGYELCFSGEEGYGPEFELGYGYKILGYKKTYNNKTVCLWIKNNRVLIVEWRLDSWGKEFNNIQIELEDVYDFQPYAQTSTTLESKINSFYYREVPKTMLYYYWKENTLILSDYSLFIISNADAREAIERSKIEQIKKEQEQKEKERLEQERKERERQEQTRKENERKERERKEAEKRQREAHVKELKSNYMPCHFLFASDAKYAICITQESQNTIENEIKTLIDQKMVEISNIIVKGTEFKDNSDAWTNMEGICNISNSMRTVSLPIANYAENKIENFVTNREKLNKAYNKAKKKESNLKCSEFLISYINNDGKNNNKAKGNIDTSNSMFLVMANAAYSIAPQTSFGLTVGSVKELGWYVSLNSNFRFEKADYECDAEGTINELTSEYSYSGNKSTSRLGATAGLVARQARNHNWYAYLGGGYGIRNVFWELENGKRAKCTDDSYQGIALDAGLMMNYGNFGLSLGVQTIGVKYLETKIGVGFTF